jgi:hypothetical protein
MDVLIALELRWFFGGAPLPALDRWFSDRLPGSEISELDRRSDVHLYHPQVDNFGIRHRQGDDKYDAVANTVSEFDSRYHSRGRCLKFPATIVRASVFMARRQLFSPHVTNTRRRRWAK